MSKSGTAIVDPFINPTKEFYDNPFPTLKRLREEAPVFRSEKGGYWIVSRYSDAHDILGDLQFQKGARKFKQIDMLSKILPKTASLLEQRGKTMLNVNPPTHTRLRSLVNKAFTPSMISKMRSHIEEIGNELLDAVQSKGKMDMMADFAFPLPATVIAEMLGVPVKDRDKFKDWSHNLTIALDPNPDINLIDMAKVVKAYDSLNEYFKGLVAQRRKERKDDMISALVDAEEEGSKLDEGELLANMILMLIAGHETTTNLIGNGTLLLLQHPDQFEKAKANPELIPSLVSEVLRYQSPVQMLFRIASEDTELGGTKIKAEDRILVSIGAVNRDPDQFADPDTFDITRNPNKHLAFGHGIHHCLGSSLAETEGQIAFSLLFKRMPNMKLASEKLEYKHPFSLRGLKQLPVTF